MTTTNQTVIGSFEFIELPEFLTGKVLAKVDTGAYSGAIHAKDIHLSDDGLRLLFRMGGRKEVQSTAHFTEATVRSALGEEQKRYIIDTPIIIDGIEYATKIGLSDRSPMKFQALLGRRFLRENGFVVDVRLNQQYDDDGESSDETSDIE